MSQQKTPSASSTAPETTPATKAAASAAAPAKPAAAKKTTQATPVGKAKTAAKTAAPLKPEQAVAKALAKTPAKAPKKVAKAVAANTTKAASKPAKAEKLKKPKLVRDSFTMPENEYALIAASKKRLLAQGIAAKKSEVLRAALALFAAQSDAALAAAVGKLAVVKTGRPAK